MAEKFKRPGYIITLKRPYKPGFVACMSITPHHEDGTPGVDTARKVERDLGRKKALQLAARLLAYSDAPADVVARVEELRAEAAGTADDAGDELE